MLVRQSLPERQERPADPVHVDRQIGPAEPETKFITLGAGKRLAGAQSHRYEKDVRVLLVVRGVVEHRNAISRRAADRHHTVGGAHYLGQKSPLALLRGAHAQPLPHDVGTAADRATGQPECPMPAGRSTPFHPRAATTRPCCPTSPSAPVSSSCAPS